MQSKGEVRWIHTWHINVVRLQNLQSPSLISSHAMIRPSCISRFSFFFFLFFSFRTHGTARGGPASTRAISTSWTRSEPRTRRIIVTEFFFFSFSCAHVPAGNARLRMRRTTQQLEQPCNAHTAGRHVRRGIRVDSQIAPKPPDRGHVMSALSPVNPPSSSPPRTPILINFAHTRRRVNQYFLFYFWYWWYPMS